MPYYLIKVSGRNTKSKLKLESVALLVKAEDRLIARGMAIDYFKKHIGDEVLSVMDVKEFEMPEGDGVIFGCVVSYDPTPISTTLLLPLG